MIDLLHFYRPLTSTNGADIVEIKKLVFKNRRTILRELAQYKSVHGIASNLLGLKCIDYSYTTDFDELKFFLLFCKGF